MSTNEETRSARLAALIADVPRRITSPFPIGKPNQPIRLYRGTAELRGQGTALSGVTTVELGYFPSPRLGFRLAAEAEGVSQLDPTLSEGNLLLSSLNTTVDVVVSSKSLRNGVVVSGRLRQRTGVGTSPDIVALADKG